MNTMTLAAEFVTLTYIQTLRSGRKEVRTRAYTTENGGREATIARIRRNLPADVIVSLV